tara:strand:+ start:495 stop:3716 length:3222 start_codon:yes stop_codon:yes gene_type:complete
MSDKYKKYSQIEHVLARPGMYVGDIKNCNSSSWVINNGKFEYQAGEWNPGIYKIFDEILTNASDEVQRNTQLTTIKVDIEDNVISVYNDSGIPIELHEEYKIYIPELIFTNLLTSSNFDDTKERTTGGLNGLGAKLTAIFSKKFMIETCKDGKKYTQIIEDNLSKINKPKITKSTKEYTRITFTPDLEKFNINCISDFTMKVLEKRVYDISAVTRKSVSVHLNSKKLNIKDFSDYINLYIGDKKTCPRVIHETERWSVAIAPSENGFQSVSFVNGINTSDGGTHVDHVINPIIKKLTEIIQEKHKSITIKPQYIKDNIFVFINCLIVNPSFSSQTKEKCITKVSEFGSKFVATDDFIKSITKIGIIENILIIADAKEKKSLQKTDGKKTTRVNIAKLDDANKAGTKESNKCTIILTEGDSAKTTAISGLSVVGRDYYGAFPLKGKILNTRTATYSQLSSNTEINNIKQIIGLQSGKKYKSLNDLRYGKILIMTDADTDGFHIKSLLINFISNDWPELLKMDFISCLVTPVIKLSKRNTILPFYNLSDYNNWKNNNDISGWKVKYYKGLGTSTSQEAKEYFKQMKTLTYNITDKDDEKSMTLAFTKTEADSRKKWILDNIKYPKTLDYNVSKVNVKDLINKELVLFSIEDNIRSIPNLVDGFKPSQRKVIYSCIKKNLTTEIKVSQLAGYISEHTSYHHGEASLQDTIINLAQNFVGSNNLNLIKNLGQFGSRLQGGKDASSPRYIFTQMTENFKNIIHPDDNELLEYLNDDGYSIEPKYYVPTLPLILINGACGIGTGFSTDIPCFNPDDIKNRLLNLVEDEDCEIEKIKPWYKNFKGEINEVDDNKWTTHGIYKIDKNLVTITELPIGTWTDDYKVFLDKLESENTIFHYKNSSTETDVHFEVSIPLENIIEWTENKEFEKKMKLVSHLSARNMFVFDEKNNITKMESPEEIIYRFWIVRTEYYQKRKINKLSKLSEERNVLKSKINFVQEIMNDTIKVFRVKLEDINKKLESKKYHKVENSYKYLTDMKIHSFSEDTISELNNKYNKIDKEYSDTYKMTTSDFWKKDLNEI